MERQTQQWTISIPPFLSRQALRLAKEESRTRSELVREALRYYMEEKTAVRLRKRLSQRFHEMGVKTEEDIERLVDEGRR